MNTLPIPNSAYQHQQAEEFAGRVGAALHGYRGASVLGIRGMYVYDVARALDVVRADVLFQVGPTQHQICTHWLSEPAAKLPDEALESNFLMMRRKARNRISRELTKANGPYSVTAVA